MGNQEIGPLSNIKDSIHNDCHFTMSSLVTKVKESSRTSSVRTQFPFMRPPLSQIKSHSVSY